MLVELEQPGVAEPLAVAGRPIKFGTGSGTPMRRAPLLGEHTDAVLAGLGYPKARVAELRDSGVVG